MDERRIVVVGAGPAGAALAYLLARRGIAVTLLERHTDFAREFRGEALMPSGVDAFAQMGLGARLDGLPQTHVRRLEVYRGARCLFSPRARRPRRRGPAHRLAAGDPRDARRGGGAVSFVPPRARHHRQTISARCCSKAAT